MVIGDGGITGIYIPHDIFLSIFIILYTFTRVFQNIKLGKIINAQPFISYLTIHIDFVIKIIAEKIISFL
jgi:hypothetical protein